MDDPRLYMLPYNYSLPVLKIKLLLVVLLVGQRDTYPCAGNRGGATGNSHRPGGNVLERGGDELAKLKI
jgi:hypothetical protein